MDVVGLLFAEPAQTLAMGVTLLGWCSGLLWVQDRIYDWARKNGW